jgi:hypothetical protein
VHRSRLIATLLLGMVLFITLYLGGSWLYIIGVSAYDHWTYGPVHLAHVEAALTPGDTPAHPTDVTALNVHGHIVILVAPHGDYTKASTYSAPMLTPRAWGNLDEVVVELDVQPQTGNILVHVTGLPDILHFDMRPALTFTLINLRPKPGFAFGPALDQ